MLLWHPGDGWGLPKTLKSGSFLKSNWPLTSCSFGSLVTLLILHEKIPKIFRKLDHTINHSLGSVTIWPVGGQHHRVTAHHWNLIFFTNVEKWWGSGKRYQAIALADILYTAKQLNSSSLSDEHLVHPIGLVMVLRHQSPRVPNVTDCFSMFCKRL